MWSYIWPILVVIIANTGYNICAKSTPENVEPFASLTVTYLVAAVISLVMFFITSKNKNLLTEVQKTNWTSIVFGIAIVGLEFGYLFVYRNGWNVSIGSLVSNIGLACVLLFVGLFIFKEKISIKQIIGMLLCVGGIILITKK
jgi:uncharacterized membrane protein